MKLFIFFHIAICSVIKRERTGEHTVTLEQVLEETLLNMDAMMAALADYVTEPQTRIYEPTIIVQPQTEPRPLTRKPMYQRLQSSFPTMYQRYSRSVGRRHSWKTSA